VVAIALQTHFIQYPCTVSAIVNAANESCSAIAETELPSNTINYRLSTFSKKIPPKNLIWLILLLFTPCNVFPVSVIY
jgi:hypothetical protein